MGKRRRQNKVVRYLRVAWRTTRQLNRVKVVHWIRKNLKQHPLILSVVFLLWVQELFIQKKLDEFRPLQLVRLHAVLAVLWVVMVFVSNLLRDKQAGKWYFKKRLVFCLLLAVSPVGLVLLWSGAKFKKSTKIVFTVLCIVFMVGSINYYHRNNDLYARKSPVEKIQELVTKQKGKSYLSKIVTGADTEISVRSIAENERLKFSVVEVASRCSPGVVSIKTKDENGDEIGLGSGFVIAKEGIIATNFHVVKAAYKAEVRIGEEVFTDVRLVKAIPGLDIALLKINSSELSALPLGNSDSLVEGQPLVVLGNPWGLERSVSDGVVSALRFKGAIKLIQMTAPVSPGSSGGPVLNEYGEVVGITTLASMFMAQNLNFAIPINYLVEMLQPKKK